MPSSKPRGSTARRKLPSERADSSTPATRPNGTVRPKAPTEDFSEHPPLAPGVKYRRILLKLSGEALMGQQGYGIEAGTLSQIADELIDVHNLGVDVGIVIGGGNIFRGLAASSSGMDRASADYMGMLAT